jgi:DHA2 family multidrug resistance protein
MTVINLQIDFTSIVWLRITQVIFLPLIFVPISTLNYLGVPREKNNQVSGMSNFARNMGGSIGTSMLTTFLARQNQAHQLSLAAHTSHGNVNFERMLSGFKVVFLSQGYDATTSATKAMAMAYRMVQAQASALSFENSFWVMSIVIACLTPLPFIMRRPKPGEGRVPAAH